MSFQSGLGTVSKAITSLLLNDLKFTLFKKINTIGRYSDIMVMVATVGTQR